MSAVGVPTMKPRLLKIVSVLTVAGALLLGVESLAVRQSPTPTAVGTVNLPEVLQALDQWKAEMSRAESAGKAYQDKHATMREDVEALRADMDDFVVGSDKYLEAERTMKRAAIDLLAYEQTAQMMEARAMQRAILEVYAAIQRSAGELASRDGYGLILMDDSVVSIPPDTANVLEEISLRKVLWADSGLDVTADLISYMNEQWQSSNGG